MTTQQVLANPVWPNIWSRHVLWVDVVLLVIACGLHAISASSPARATSDPGKLAESVRGGATGGLTIVGILIPLSVLAIQLRAGTSDVDTRLPNAVLIDFFMGDVWLVFSLAFGLYVLFVAAMRGTYEDIGQKKSVVMAFGFQLMFLFVGVFRLVWGLSGLVGSLLAPTH